jgi:hypothetical protein
MTATETRNWIDVNQRYLAAAVAHVRMLLEQHAAPSAGTGAPNSVGYDMLDAIAATMETPPALETLRTAFHLSPFECHTLLLCAAMEFDAAIAPLCAGAQGVTDRPYPTFSLALAALPDAHWSALTPTAPLRHWRLIEVGAGPALTLSPLRIDERVMHYLAGVRHRDARLIGLIAPLPAARGLVPSHQAAADRIVATWRDRGGDAPMPVVQLCGSDAMSKRGIAATACDALGLEPLLIAADAFPTAPAEIDALVRLWEREALLEPCALILDCDEIDSADSLRVAAVARFIDQMRGLVIISGQDRQRARQRPVVTLDVDRPGMEEQGVLWRAALGDTAPHLNGHLDALLSQFSLGTAEIASASAMAHGEPEERVAAILWEACRVQSRARLDDLAQRIVSPAGWDDLVLPEAQRGILREIAVHVRQRATVYQQWGFASKGARGLGVSALFAGASGTGKTMAAEVLANELKLDCYRIDLSSVVSKYIGETEKNLRRVFDAAEAGGAILLFDEADALFGKRSEVKDSHDRYANIEVSYLLQRMESYRGLAILTTNLKSALDTAFLRRIRFVVQFPFPDAAQRAEIWRRVFPLATPTEGLAIEPLAQLNVAGGNIRNIAINAAFMAAEAREPVRMAHLLHAAQMEYAKIEKPLTSGETAGWLP